MNLFLTFCIPSRVALAVAPQYLSDENLRKYSLVLYLIGSGFGYLYLTNSRTTAMESSHKNKETWWAEYRIYHSLLFLTAGYLANSGNKNASIPLAIDVAFGLALYLNKKPNNDDL